MQYNPVFQQLNKPLNKYLYTTTRKIKFQTKARRFLFHVSARRFESIGVAARKQAFAIIQLISDDILLKSCGLML